MAIQRSLICLKCGRKYYIDKEIYDTEKKEPICNVCKEEFYRSQQPNGLSEVGSQISNTVGDVISAGVNTIANGLGTFLNKHTSNSQGESNEDDDLNVWADSSISKSKNKPFIGHSNTFESHSDFCKQSTVKNNFVNNCVSNNAKENWTNIGKLATASLSEYSDYVGLYMHTINGRVMYIGRAVEYNNGGLRKRLSDYRRLSGSARKSPAGQLVYNNLDKIVTYVWPIGTDYEAAEITKRLEPVYIKKYMPPWNVKLK